MLINLGDWLRFWLSVFLSFLSPMKKGPSEAKNGQKVNERVSKTRFGFQIYREKRSRFFSVGCLANVLSRYCSLQGTLGSH